MSTLLYYITRVYVMGCHLYLICILSGDLSTMCQNRTELGSESSGLRMSSTKGLEQEIRRKHKRIDSCRIKFTVSGRTLLLFATCVCGANSYNALLP